MQRHVRAGRAGSGGGGGGGSGGGGLLRTASSHMMMRSMCTEMLPSLSTRLMLTSSRPYFIAGSADTPPIASGTSYPVRSVIHSYIRKVGGGGGVGGGESAGDGIALSMATGPPNLRYRRINRAGA